LQFSPGMGKFKAMASAAWGWLVVGALGCAALAYIIVATEIPQAIQDYFTPQSSSSFASIVAAQPKPPTGEV
jgi:hypothetical protein